VLILSALASLVRIRLAFGLDALLSALVVLMVGLFAISGIVAGIPLTLLAVVAVILNVLAYRRKGTLSEQSNPMNLPVFG
jgi:hypothetical protein